LLKAFLKISSFSCRIFDVKIFGIIPNEYPNPATIVTEALIYTCAKFYTLVIFFLQIQLTIKHQIEKWRGFSKWCISWSGNLNIKNSYENRDKFKNGLSKKGVEYL
jgi:hypothetical protein